MATSAAVYIVLSLIFPVPLTPASRPAAESYEWLSNKEGFYDEDLPWDVTATGVDTPRSGSISDDSSSTHKGEKEQVHVDTKEV